MNTPKYGVCILSHRTAHAAAELARMVLVHQDPTAVIIVENGEQHRDQELLLTLVQADKRVHVLFCPNRGYAHGNNLGLRHLLTEMHCSWGIVLNPDVSIPSSVRLSEWIQAAESDGVVVSGPQILDKNGKVTQPLMVLSPWNAVLRSSTPILGHIHATTGCAIAIQLKPFFSWGGFDERLFLYREEQALGHTLEQHGLNWGYHPTFCVVHDHQRKVSSYSNWLKHRIWEYQSTLHIFSSYQKRTILDVCWYRVLFGIKSTIYALLLPLIARK